MESQVSREETQNGFLKRVLQSPLLVATPDFRRQCDRSENECVSRAESGIRTYSRGCDTRVGCTVGRAQAPTDSRLWVGYD
ncbi:hypothetical protein EVAR_25686_1 [Eumeta japonica]|uniref:Uncharacterized protein n=1 Tax=Eumeta variegata TaxID=151549 RepID=A0A4C1WG48_EUMVA|nr:hypothetical protein EVAR_25686_1 [Eumeta japonica]